MTVLTPAALAAIACPPGLTLAAGGTREADLSLLPAPDFRLDTPWPNEILEMLDYAGLRYAAPDSPAAGYGIALFKEARAFAMKGLFDRVTFDWDHTLSNYKIFDDVLGVIRTKMRSSPPGENLARGPMVALEVARPFMQETAFGMMVGYAHKQGLRSLQDWTAYEPQVGLVTHTWPDRLGVLGRHFMRLVPLLEGLIPGTPDVYKRLVDRPRSIVHLHDFLDYARSLMARFERDGFAGLSPVERDEVLAYCEDGKAHYRKPVGALAAHGWQTSSLLHFDDSTRVIADFAGRAGVRAVHVRQPHSDAADVGEINKVALSSLVRSREASAAAVVRDLARMEAAHATFLAVAGVLGALQVYPEGPWPDLRERNVLPDGVLLTVHETPTTLGEFWEYYVGPTNELKHVIRSIVKARGGLAAVRRERAQSPG